MSVNINEAFVARVIAEAGEYGIIPNVTEYRHQNGDTRVTFVSGALVRLVAIYENEDTPSEYWEAHTALGSIDGGTLKNVMKRVSDNFGIDLEVECQIPF